MATLFDNTEGSSIILKPGYSIFGNSTSGSKGTTTTNLTKTTPSGQVILSSKGVNVNKAGSGGTGATEAKGKKGGFGDIDWDQVQDAAVSAGLNLIGDLAYGVSGRKTTKAGEVLHTSSQFLNTIPVIGPGLGALTNIVGGIVNSNWGSYVNNAAVDAMKTRIHNYTTDYSSPSSNKQLLQDFATTGGMNFITTEDIDSEGSKAKKITAELNDQIYQANRDKISHMMAAANTLDSDYDRNMRANFSAFGGPITGAIDYANMIDYTVLKRKQIDKGLQYAEGGGIHIKPSKRGTFTAAATKHGMGVQEFASRVLENKEDYSPAMVKKANFARNAAKWHAFGGDLMTNGATWDNGFTYVGNGGSHESNPNEGVQVGVDPNGVPNLVEEGEVIWNDYVFSRRLKVPKSFRDKYKFKDGGSLSFADAAKKFAEENKERPNDPISKRGRDALLSALMDTQEEVRLKKQQREAKAQFNSLTPDEQLGIMQMAQQNAMYAGPEEDYNNMEESPMMMEEAPMMAAFGGKIFSGGGLKSYKKKTDIEKNLPWLKNLYVTDPNDTTVWDALFDANGNIIATKGGTTGLYDPNGAYMKALSSLSAENWDKWSDSQKQQFVTNLKTINPDKYKNYTIKDVGRGAWSWNNLKALASDGYVGGHHQVAQFASQITPPTATPSATSPARKAANRFFLRDTDAKGNPIATPLTNIPDIYEGYSTTTGQTWDEAIKSLGFSRVGNPQKSSEGDTDYTDYFFSKKAPVTTPTPQEDTKITMPLDLQQTASRYMPVIGAGVGVLTDALGLTNTPDFSSAKALEKAAERVGTPSLIRAQTIGNRLAYRPFDLSYYTTQARSNAALTGRSIMNQSSGNIGATTAGLLALGQNTTTQMGDLFRKAEEFNLEQRAKVEDFNRATDMFNAQQELTAARANQAERRQASAAYAAGIAQAEALRQRAQQYSDTARSANLTNFLQGLGDIGNENEQRNWLKTLYATSYFGNSPIMERVLYSDSDVLANYMKKNPSAKVDDVVAATGINKRKVTRYFKKKGLTI